MKATTKVFVDKDGNRFIVGGMVNLEGDDSTIDIASLTIKALMVSVAIGCKLEPGFFEFDPSILINVETEIYHPAFVHGGANIVLIGGPRFDAVKQKVQN